MLVGPGTAPGFHSQRQALGLGVVEVLEARRFENGTNGKSLVRQEPTASADLRHVHLDSKEGPAVEPDVVLTLSAAQPAVVATETHHVELTWEEPRHLLSPSPPPLGTSAATEAAKCSWSYVVEMSQPAPVSAPLPSNANSKSMNGNGNHAGVEWHQLQRATGRTCKVSGLKPGTTYQMRLVLVEVKHPTADANGSRDTTAAAAAESQEGRAARSGVIDASAAAAKAPFRIVCVPSASITCTTLPTAPSTPQAPSLSSRERKALKLKWLTPEEAGGAKTLPLKYVLYCKPPPTELETDACVDAEGFVEVYSGEEKSAKVSKLKPGARYSFKLKASNKIGDSPGSLISTFMTQATVPSQPDPPAVVSSTSDSITLQWSRPAENGSSITSYCLERDDGQGGAEFQLVYAGNQLSAAAKGLKHGAKYQFRLLAMNDEGKSLWSACSFASTAPVAPSSPSSLTVVSVSMTCATLSWHPPGDSGGSAVTSYQVELQPKCRAALEHMGPSWLSIFEGDALACTISSLRAGCAYRARVRASSPAGWSLHSVPIDVVTAPGPPDAPEPPTLGIAEVAFLGVQWTPPAHHGGSKLTYYRLEVAQESPCACGLCPTPAPAPSTSSSRSPSPPPPLQPCSSALQTQSVQMTTPSDVCTAEIRDLTPSTAYYFRLAAGNAVAMSSWSEWTRISTCADVPSAPGNLRQAVDSGVAGGAEGAVAGGVSVPAPPGLCSAVSASVSATLAWEPAEARGAAVQQYVVEAAGAAPAAQEGGALQYVALYRGPLCSGLKIKGLGPASKYCFRVAAVCAMGTGPWSEALALISPAAAPEPPRALRAQSASGPEPQAAAEQQGDGCSPQEQEPAAPLRSVALSWQPPLSDNGAAVGAYFVEMSPPPPGAAPAALAAAAPPAAGGGRRAAPPSPLSSWHQAANVAAPLTEAVVSGLQAGRTYCFRVRAVNALGSSPHGDVATAATAAAPPTQPQRLQVSSRSSNGLRLRWDEPLRDNGSAVQLYQLEVGTYRTAQGPCPEPALEPEQPSDSLLAAAVAVTLPEQSVSWSLVYSGREAQAKVQGLEPHQRYLLRCRAVNAAGVGAWCAELAAETALAPPAPPQEPSAEPLPARSADGEDGGGGAAVLLRWRAAGELAFRAAAIGFEVMVAAAAGPGLEAGSALAPAGQAGPAAAAVAAWHAPVSKMTVGRGATECRVEGLLGGTGYVCRVRAVGAEGSGHSGWSDEVVVVTDGQRRGARGEAGEGSHAGKGQKAKKEAAKRASSFLASAAAEAEPACASTPVVAAAAVASTSLRRTAAPAARKAKALPPAGAAAAPSAGPSSSAAAPSQGPGRKQPRASLLSAAANIPRAAPRPSRRSILEQAWRKAWRLLWQHGWKLLVVWLILALIAWVVYVLRP